MPCLIIGTGPIGSGKSTLAMELGGQARSSGRSAAVIDLDIVYDMLDHRQKSDAAVWLMARQTAAILSDHFFKSGFELVVVEGSFCDLDERVEFLATLTTPITPHIVTLHVSLEQALHRVESDPTRGIRRVALSREPAFLATNHADFAARSAAVSANDLIIDTETISTPGLKYSPLHDLPTLWTVQHRRGTAAGPRVPRGGGESYAKDNDAAQVDEELAGAIFATRATVVK